MTKGSGRASARSTTRKTRSWRLKTVAVKVCLPVNKQYGRQAGPAAGFQVREPPAVRQAYGRRVPFPLGRPRHRRQRDADGHQGDERPACGQDLCGCDRSELLCSEGIDHGASIAAGHEHAFNMTHALSSQLAGCGLTAAAGRSPRTRCCWARRQPRCRQRLWLWRSASSVLPPSSRAGALCSDGGSLALQWSATLPAHAITKSA